MCPALAKVIHRALELYSSMSVAEGVFGYNYLFVYDVVFFSSCSLFHVFTSFFSYLYVFHTSGEGFCFSSKKPS